MAPVIQVEDLDDPAIALYRDIRERDLVGRDGMFMAEGETVLQALLRSPWHRPISLLLAERRVASLAPLLAMLPQPIPIYRAGQALLDRIAGFPLHRGILALGRQGAMPSAADLLRNAGSRAAGSRAMVIVLIGTANHDNLGGVFRNAAAFGATAILLDDQCCDPFYRKAIRVSVGATLLTPWARVGSADNALALLAASGFTAVGLSPGGAVSLPDWRRPARVAAFFGAEGPGLPLAVLKRIETLSIPISASLDSLNLATASGITLYHLITDKGDR